MTDQTQSHPPGYHEGRNRRITLALLTQGAIDPNNRAIWSGAAAAAHDAGVNLICYPGRPMRSPAEFEVQRNIIYRMVDVHTVDGVVFWGINPWMDMEETYSFIRRFHPMPIVTTGIVLEGIPGVTADNYHGMREVVSHLINVHHRRKIAFIRGPANHQEANDRYQAYLDVLKEYGIPPQPELVYLGDFKESGGVKGAKVLLEKRALGWEFDALVAASDNMALGAMKTFQSCGLLVPDDVSIAGLNGEDQGLFITPPLTTAPLHFYEQAYQATMMTLSLLQGKQVPLEVILPTRMVVRQSCGCADPLVTHAEAIPHTEKLDSFTDEIRLLNGQVFGEESPGLQQAPDEPVRLAFPTLLKSFLAESQGKSSGKFLSQFTKTLQHTSNASDAFLRWHEILSTLRQFAISQLTDHETRLRVENLTQQARVLISESARRHYAFQTLQADEKLHTLGEISQGLNIITTTNELTAMLELSLQMLKIPRYYVFLYEDPGNPEGQARLIFSYENNQRSSLEQASVVFPARQLLPTGLLDVDRQYNLVVEPLFFREDQLGYAVFEADPREEAIYEILGGQISAALKRVTLTERNIRLFDEAVEARQAAEQANLLKSRFLSMVSHELRTPLALIVGTVEMMLQEEKNGGNPPLPAPYRKDMDSIHTSSQHLFRLIGDVLDLASNQAGELRLVTEPLDLSKLFFEATILGKTMAREKGLQWREQMPLSLPLVMGDRTRLRQVILNLVSNAVKFTEHGYVSLTVRANDTHVMVDVSDTGMGIPLDEQAVIFDEFRRSERSVARGYGGMGLGLAITRRLIELHGGEIGVTSTGVEETGSTFHFNLPIIMDPSTTGSEIRESRYNTVLLLIESSSDRMHLQQHLKQKGFEVEVMDVSDQQDWLSQVVSRPPGAVVLDFQPATERGWELMQLIKQNPETRDVPVVFYSLSAERSNGSMLEMDYLTKPVGSADLSQALERLGLKINDGRQIILVVDDDPNVLDMHVRILESLVNCSIIKANNGKKALEIIQSQPVSLVLLDLMMPEVDGFEVLRVMREQESTRRIPVIVLSAQILTANDMLRLQEGVAAVLGKGLFSIDEVLNQVEASLSHSKRLGSQASRTVRQAMAYIHGHYAEPITRTQLAGHLAVSDRYLTRCFHQEIGITPVTYLNRYRIRKARELIEKHALSITEVAQMVGFSGSNYFGRVFREEVGVSPSAYFKT
jgi:signal transduction histidine kinase/DNA-binding LacI/PurR family transcriptional regulator/DNA-binding response OmpR family regulator